MPVEATKEFADSFDQEATPTVFIDAENLIRDLFIEDMFVIAFQNIDLHEGFRHNFRTYMQGFFGADPVDDVPDQLFEDEEYAKQFVRIYFGLCHIAPLEGNDDADFDHCTHTATTRTQFSDGDPVVVHAPSALRAALLSIITIMRWRADLHFKTLVNSEQEMDDVNQAEDN